MKKLIWRSGLALMGLFLCAAIALVWDGLHDDIGKADVAVVFGNTVDTKGNPSDRLKARLDRSIELYRDGRFKIIIVSGGIGKEGFPEGTAMQTYLLSHGIPAEAIVVDNKGNDTWATAQNTRNYLDLHGLRSVLVISQYFHVPRSVMAMEKAGISTVYSAHAKFFEMRDFYSIVREVPAWIKYRLRPQTITGTQSI